MESPGETCRRLLDAIETLAIEEEAGVRHGDPATMVLTQHRAEPVIARLVELLGKPETRTHVLPALRPRLLAVQARRTASLQLLAARLEAIRARRNLLDTVRRRLGGLKAAYGAVEPTDCQTPAPHLHRCA
ncbi:MAG: hypothetical protein PHE83_03990 [Opitutaceae bacterium]|nr:hypothetical protein [Opitutaceae bacterium]